MPGDAVLQSGDGKQHTVSRAALNRALAQVQSALDDYFGSCDPRSTRDIVGCARERERILADKVMETHRRWIGQQASKVIEACSGMITESDDKPRRFQPRPRDLEYAISLLLEARPKKHRRGRPGSPKVNGPRLKELRREAGMTQAGLIEAVDERLGLSTEPHRRTLQRYEQSEPGDPKRLAVIAALLTERLFRKVHIQGICLPRRKEDDNTGTRLQRQVERLSGLDRNDWIRGPRDLVS
jgi:transcriptional regulator with XRE-family HTH domain